MTDPSVGETSGTAPASGPVAPSGAVVARSGLWGLGGNAVTLVASLVATPFTIRLLGPERYGLWALLQSTVAYLTLSDFGMGTASTRFAGQRFARGDRRGEAAVVWAACCITATLTASAALVCFALAPQIVRGLLGSPQSLERAAILGIRLLAAAFVLRALANTLNTPQLVRLRWPVFTVITTVTSVLQVAIVPIVLATVGGGVAAAAGVVVAAAGLAAAGHLIFSARLLPPLKHPEVRFALFKPLLAYGGGFALSSLASIPLLNAERFFLSQSSDLTAVAHYAVAGSLAMLLIVIPNAATQPLLPALSRLTAMGEQTKLVRLYEQSTGWVAVAVAPAAVALVYFSSPFLRLWAGADYANASTRPFWILLAGLWIGTLAHVPVNLLLALGRTSLVARLHLAEVPIYLLTCWVLVGRFGAVGAATAWALRMALDAAVVTVLASRAAHAQLTTIAMYVVRSVALVAPLAAVLAGASVVISGLAERVVVGLPLFVVFGLVLRRRYLSEQSEWRLERLPVNGVPPDG